MNEKLKNLDEEDIYLINRFGVTKKAIVHILNAYRAKVISHVEEVIEHCDYFVDPKAYRDFTDEEWAEIEENHDEDADGYYELYKFPDSPEKAFMDIISFHTRFGGHGSAIEACGMAGVKWEKDSKNAI